VRRFLADLSGSFNANICIPFLFFTERTKCLFGFYLQRKLVGSENSLLFNTVRTHWGERLFTIWSGYMELNVNLLKEFRNNYKTIEDLMKEAENLQSNNLKLYGFSTDLIDSLEIIPCEVN